MALCVIVAAVVGIGVLFFGVEICDGQLTSAGTVVKVCRHPQVNDPPVGALGLVVLVMLSFLFTEVSGFGFTLKRSIDVAKRTAQEAVREAQATHRQIDEIAEDLTDGVKAALEKTHVTAKDESDPVKRLSARYNEIRWTMPSGHARTAAMSAVVRDMVALFEGGQSLDLAGSLASGDRGVRLAAVAALYAHPDPAWADRLAQIAVSEDKPFNEYWALKTLRRLLDNGAVLSEQSTNVLTRRLAKLPPGVDRAAQIGELLERAVRG